jgi:Na+/H+-translocating membrane pyrophosphatase
MVFPLAVHCLDILASTVGMWYVQTKRGVPEYNIDYGTVEDPLDVMKKGYRVSMGLGTVGFPIICYFFLNHEGSWIEFSLCGWIGILISYLILELTRYYTDYNCAPVRKIVNASKYGPATNIIAGIAVGLESTALPVLLLCLGLLCSYQLGNLIYFC